MITHLIIVGSLAIAWTGYGIYRRRTRWVVEGLLLFAFLIWNTLHIH